MGESRTRITLEDCNMTVRVNCELCGNSFHSFSPVSFFTRNGNFVCEACAEIESPTLFTLFGLGCSKLSDYPKKIEELTEKPKTPVKELTKEEIIASALSNYKNGYIKKDEALKQILEGTASYDKGIDPSELPF